MKFLHTSDIHLDSPLTSRLSPEKRRQRRRELLLGFERLISEAKRLSVNSVIIAGDLFDSEKISRRALDTALDVIEASPTLSFFYLPGNHEKDAIISSGRDLPKNLFIFGEEWCYFRADNVVIAGRSRLSDDMLESLSLNPSDKNIVVLHGELRDRSASGGVIGIKDTEGKGIDYLALGHYHTHRSYPLPDGGYAVYSGTPEGRGFDECGELGFVLIDTEDIKNYRFVPFAQRIIKICQLDITGIDTRPGLDREISRTLADLPSRDLVRLELIGYRSDGLWIDPNGIYDKYSDRFFYFEVKDSTRLMIRREDFQYDKTLKGEFIRLVTAREDLDERTKEKVIEMGLYALMGEEV